MPYPSTVTTFTNPQPADKLNNPSHSSIETAQNRGLTEIQTFVGTEASTVGTLFYDIRSANSNGGGHVQTANKGGTGLTSFAKGDILVASSSSVLTKLTVGANDTVLTADSNAAAGIKWNVNATSAPKAKTQVPMPLLPFEPGSADVIEGISFADIPGSVLVGKVTVPIAMTVNRIGFYGNITIVGHRLAINMYTADGTRSVLGVQACMMSADAASVYAAVPGASITAGDYYVTAQPSVMSSILTYFWRTDGSTPISDLNNMTPQIAGVLPRTMASAPPASIMVSSINGAGGSKTFLFRLDE